MIGFFKQVQLFRDRRVAHVKMHTRAFITFGFIKIYFAYCNGVPRRCNSLFARALEVIWGGEDIHDHVGCQRTNLSFD